ncbi:MAG: hypothetical protein JWR21_831, partial [Herminiimonas sp.]|nr:hypothetical protein [Herminiimonas sp.]
MGNLPKFKKHLFKTQIDPNFDAVDVMRLLISDEKVLPGHKIVVLAGLCAWAVEPIIQRRKRRVSPKNKIQVPPGLPKSIKYVMVVAATRFHTRSETALMRGKAAKLQSRVLHLALFKMEILNPLGGKHAIEQVSTLGSYRRRIKSRYAKGILSLVKAVELSHIRLYGLGVKGGPWWDSSFKKSAKAAKAIFGSDSSRRVQELVREYPHSLAILY